METLKDFENAIKEYVENNPTINDKPTLGLSLLADDWRIKISTTNPAVAATGGPDDGEWYYDTKTGEAELHLMRPDEREYFRWLNHMNDIGLLDPESFIQKYDQYQAKIAEGRVVALADAKWEYVDAEVALVAAGMPERAYGMYPLTLDDSYTFADFRPVGYSGGYGIGISTSCEDPVAAIKFLDWMCTDEAQILARWGGLEGDHYVVEDGHRKFTDEIFKMQNEDPNFSTVTGIGIYSWPWLDTVKVLLIQTEITIAQLIKRQSSKVILISKKKYWMLTVLRCGKTCTQMQVTLRKAHTVSYGKSTFLQTQKQR